MSSDPHNLDTIAGFIADNALFESLSRPVVRSIAAQLQEQHFAPGKIVMQEGEVGDSFYIIRSGHVRAVLNREGQDRILSEMGPGEGFGEMALLSDQPRSCTIKAIDDAHLFVLNREAFEDLYMRFPELAFKFEELRTQRVSLLEDKDLKASTVSKFTLSLSSDGVLDHSILDTLSKLNEAAGGPEQVEHCKETGQLAKEMSKILCPPVGEALLFAGYVHEIGKIAIPRELIVKERQGQPLTADEAEYFTNLYTRAGEILKPNQNLYKRLDFISDLDSACYPDMRLEAQILKVANDFLELRSKYYRNLSDAEALERMDAQSGTLYNPRILTSLHKNIGKFRDVRVEAQLNAVRMIVLALDRKDNYTYRHSLDVRNITSELGRRLHLNRQDQRLAELAAELHDAGKIYIDESILNAPRRLTEEEFAIMKTHARRSADFFADIYGMEDLEKIISAHHEKYNGQGYPLGLKGEDIPFIARIMAVADVWSALTTPRIYRQGSNGKPTGMPIDKAFQEMEHMAELGHFDPNIFAEFRKYVQENQHDATICNNGRDLPDA